MIFKCGFECWKLGCDFTFTPLNWRLFGAAGRTWKSIGFAFILGPFGIAADWEVEPDIDLAAELKGLSNMLKEMKRG